MGEDSAGNTYSAGKDVNLSLGEMLKMQLPMIQKMTKVNIQHDDDGYPPKIKHGARPYILFVRQLARNRYFKSLLIISMCDFPASHV